MVIVKYRVIEQRGLGPGRCGSSFTLWVEDGTQWWLSDIEWLSREAWAQGDVAVVHPLSGGWNTMVITRYRVIEQRGLGSGRCGSSFTLWVEDGTRWWLSNIEWLSREAWAQWDVAVVHPLSGGWNTMVITRYRVIEQRGLGSGRCGSSFTLWVEDGTRWWLSNIEWLSREAWAQWDVAVVHPLSGGWNTMVITRYRVIEQRGLGSGRCGSSSPFEWRMEHNGDYQI